MTLTARSAFVKIVLKALLTSKHVKKCVFEKTQPMFMPVGTGGERGGQGKGACRILPVLYHLPFPSGNLPLRMVQAAGLRL